MAEIAGLKFKGLDRHHLLGNHCEHCRDVVGHDGIRFVITANAEYIVRAQKERRLRNLLYNKITTFDGTIPCWIARVLNPKIKIEKISGSDLIYDVAELAMKEQKKLFLLGGHHDSNRLSVERLKKKYPGLLVAGFSPEHANYPFPDKISQSIIEQIDDFKPNFLFVAFGVLKQEYWIEDHLHYLEDIGVNFVVGCGGTFDFVSQRITRAPKIIQKAGLEGVWRLMKEPKWFRVKRILMSTLIFYYSFFTKKH